MSVTDPETATSMEFSANGKLLAVSYGNPAARLYFRAHLALLAQLEANEGLSLSLDMDSTVNNLAVAAGQNVLLYALPAGVREPVCFMDIAASSPSVSGIQYVRKGIGYTIPCGMPDSARRRLYLRLRAGQLPFACSDTGCGTLSDAGCNCVSDTGCSCDGDVGCGCVSDVCGCVSDYGCGCVSDSGCSCVSDTGCGCDGDVGCGCDSD